MVWEIVTAAIPNPDMTEMWRDLLALFALVVAPSIGLGARLLELFATLAGVRGGVRWGEVR